MSMSFNKPPSTDLAISVPKAVSLWAFSDDNPLGLSREQVSQMLAGGRVDFTDEQHDRIRKVVAHYWRTGEVLK